MVERARITQVQWNQEQRRYDDVSGGRSLNVQFNPESLRVTYTNENRGGTQSSGSEQNTSQSKSKMNVELFFDTTETGYDVRRYTLYLAFFAKQLEQGDPGYQAPGGANGGNNRVVPSVRFAWGTFIFYGIVQSMEERLDYFSEDGKALRATVTMEIDSPAIRFDYGRAGQSSRGAAGQGGGQAPGTQPMTQAPAGSSLQQLAGALGRSGDWKAIAAANGIENPLRLQGGALLNMNAGASASAGFGAQAGASAFAGASAGASAFAGTSAGASFGAGAGAQAGFSAGLGAGAGFGASAGASFGAGAPAGFGASANAAVSASAGASAGASFGAGDSFGASAGASASFNASVGSTASFGASAGAGASLGAGASAGASFSAGATTSAGASFKAVSTSSLLEL